MAQINLLKANYTGSIGNTTGVELAGQNVIKAKIWSKAPASQLQKNNVRAFEALNRVCGVMARRWAKWLPVKKQNKLLHNALAHYFKKVVEKHTFDVSGFEEHVLNTSKITVTDFSYNQETGALKFTANATLQYWEQKKESWIVIVADAKGNILNYAEPKATTYTFDAKVTTANPERIYVLCFASAEIDGKKYFTAFYPEMPVSNGVWYVGATGGVMQYWVENKTLYIVAPAAYVENGVLHI